MIIPNKVVSLDSSVLGNTVHILNVGPHSIRVIDLFVEVGSKFESIDQFLLAIDVLYILNRIDLDFREEKITYAS